MLRVNNERRSTMKYFLSVSRVKHLLLVAYVCVIRHCPMMLTLYVYAMHYRQSPVYDTNSSA